MRGYESDYLEDLESNVEKRKGERGGEKLDYSSNIKNGDKEFNEMDEEELTKSNLEVISELMELGEDIGDSLEIYVEKRRKIIEILIKKGELNNISEACKNKINEYMENCGKVISHEDEEER